MDFYEVSKSIKTKGSEQELNNEIDELQSMIEKDSLLFNGKLSPQSMSELVLFAYSLD